MTPTTEPTQMQEFIVRGGIAPTIGASNFGHEKLIISKKRKDETGNNNRTKERILNNS